MAEKEDTDKILEQEIGEVGARSGAWPAEVGARWAARRLSNNAFGASIELDVPASEALAELVATARALGRIVDQRPRIPVQRSGWSSALGSGT